MSLARNRSVLLVLATLAALVLASAVRSDAQSSSATLPSSSVVWDRLLKVTVGCALQSGSCTGNLSVRAPGASESDNLAGGDYSVAAGTTKTLSFDPGGAASKQLDSLQSVVVRIAPSMGQGDPFEATLQVEHPSGSGGGGSGGSNLPPARSRKHRRHIIFAGFTEKTTLIVWAGELYTQETRTAKCVKHKLLKVQKRVGRRWLTVGTIRTGAAKREHPGFSAKFSKLFPIDRSHRFRALAPRVKVGRQICLRATSRSVAGSGGKSPR